MSVPAEHMLVLSALLFSVGALGFFLRRNLIVVLMCIELMLNAANLSLLAGARLHSGTEAGLDGPIFVIFVIAIAAVEAAIGLALVIALFRRKETVSLDALNELGG